MAGMIHQVRREAWHALLLALVIAVGCLRVVSTYRVFWQTWDEPFHIAAGMEWLERGEYTYERFHPPLVRVMAALGPYLDGVRGVEGASSPWEDGNTLLHTGGDYERNLTLARLGILPFFVVACLIVALWAWRYGGWTAALCASLLFTTLPTVLGHAGLATLDMACAALVAATLFALTLWLPKPTPAHSVLLGLSAGLAVASKFSTLAFLTIGGGVTVVIWWMGQRRRRPARDAEEPRHRRLVGAVAALFVLAITVWASYRCSIAPLVGPDDRPHDLVDRIVGADGAVHDAAYRFVENTPLPAPEFWDGLADFFHREQRGHLEYLLGRVRRGGWWYYFPVVLAVKTPLAFLLLAGIGIVFVLREATSERRWFPLATPPLAAAGVLLVGMAGKVDNGVRQMLSIYPLLAVMAGYGVARLISRPQAHRIGLWLAMALCGWQLVSSAVAHPDYLAYFNELAGRHPENIVVDGDLDWGQDLKRLAQTVEKRGITELSVDYNGSLGIELRRFPLPPTRQLEPYRRETGWVAVSALSLKIGTGRAPYDQFAWLDGYQPVERVGKSIWLYYIPAE